MSTIGDGTFAGCTSLTNITIPDCVESIGDEVFKGCNELISIIYEGTKEQWKAIRKGFNWSGYGVADRYTVSGPFVVHCTDGDILKQNA